MHFLDASRNYFQLSIHFNIKCPWRRGSDLTCQLHGPIFIIFSERETIFSFLSRAATFSLSSSNCNKSFRRAKNVTFLSSSQIKILLFFSYADRRTFFISQSSPDPRGNGEEKKTKPIELHFFHPPTIDRSFDTEHSYRTNHQACIEMSFRTKTVHTVRSMQFNDK